MNAAWNERNVVRPRTPELYSALLDTLDQADRDAVLQAIKRHDAEVRAAEAAGLRAVESM